MRSVIKKRVISALMAVILAFGIAGTGFASEKYDLDALIGNLLQFSSQDRQNMFFLFKPMLATDSGLDAIVSCIESYRPDSESIIDQLIGKLLAATDQETAIQFVKSIKIIDEETRGKYLADFDSRKSFALSGPAQTAVQNYLQVLYQEHPNLKTLFEEDRITGGVVANQMKILVDVNDNKPLLTGAADYSADFALHYLSPAFVKKANAVLSQFGENRLEDMVQGFIDTMNTEYTADQKANFKVFAKEIGLYFPQKTDDGDVVNPGPSGGNATPVDKDTEIRYTVGKAADLSAAIPFEKYNVIDVALYKNGDKQTYGKLSKPAFIQIPVLLDNAMLYRFDGEQFLPVKYNIYSDGKILARIDATGYYVVVSEQNYFNDVSGWSSFYVEALYRRNIVSGVGDQTFRPDDLVKREEFVKLAVETFEVDTGKGELSFHDVGKDAWYYPYVLAAYENGIVNGISPERFGSGEPITRQDLCKLLYSTMQKYNITMAPGHTDAVFADQSEIADYAKESVIAMRGCNIISGDENNRFRPNDPATRQEAAKVICGVLNLYIRSFQSGT